MLIMTHNFDFYRTVAGRIPVARENRLVAECSDNNLKLEKEFYQDKPFKNWKNKPTDKYILHCYHLLEI